MADFNSVALPLSQPAAEFPCRTRNMFDDEDGLWLEEDFGGLPGDPDFADSPLTEAQCRALLGDEPGTRPEPDAATPSSATPTTPPSNRAIATSVVSPSESLSASSEVRVLLPTLHAQTPSTTVGNRKRYRSKGPPEGYYMRANKTSWWQKEKARETDMKVKFGLDTFEKKTRSDKHQKILYDRSRKILCKFVQVEGATAGPAASAANKQQRRKQFGAMSLAEKQRLYLAVVRGDSISNDDRTVLLEFGGFTGWTGPCNGVYKNHENLPVAGRLNTRALLITYQSPKLVLRAEGLANLDDKELVKKLLEIPAVQQLVHDLPEAMDGLARRNSAEKTSWSLEVCLHSYVSNYSESSEIRLHMHVVLQRDLTPFRCRTVAKDLTVGGIEPSHVAGCSDPVTGK